MTELATIDNKVLELPPSVVSRVDVSRLVREVEQIDNAMTAAAVREKTSGQKEAAPEPSPKLNDFLVQNQCSLASMPSRRELIAQLRHLKDTMPIIHLTFAAEADPESLSKLAAWLRSSVHPQAVLAVGLQPSLIAGVYVRTSNKVYDLSLRARLHGSRGVLVDELEALRGGR